jgi:transposase
MDVHQNAKNTPRGRRSMVRRLAEGWTIRAVAAAFGVDPKTVRKWQGRFAAEGEADEAVRAAYEAAQPDGPRSFAAVAWACRGVVPGRG